MPTFGVAFDGEWQEDFDNPADAGLVLCPCNPLG
jgi:hypothetical protein